MKVRILPLNILQNIPNDRLVTYGKIAEVFGDKSLSRLVANEISKNNDPSKFECFRVINSDFSVGGYSFGGPDKKREILEKKGFKIQNGKVLAEKKIWSPIVGRFFIAIDFDEKTKDKIEKLSNYLKEKIKTLTQRFSTQNPRKSHVTLHFFGDLEEVQRKNIISRLKSFSVKLPKKLRVRYISSFLSERKEVIFLSLEKSYELIQFYKSVLNCLDIYPSRFSPHITLFRNFGRKLPTSFFNQDFEFDIYIKSLGLFCQLEYEKQVKIVEFTD